MAVNKRIPLTQAVIDQDRAELAALKARDDYRPSDPAFSIEALSALEAQACAAEEQLIRSTQEFVAARDAAAVSEWVLHNMVQGIQAAVIKQYGENSAEVKAIGLRKKRRPTRRTRGKA